MEVVYSHQTVSGNHPDLGKLFTHSTICAVYPLLAVDDKSGTEFLWISPQNSNKIAYHTGSVRSTFFLLPHQKL